MPGQLNHDVPSLKRAEIGRLTRRIAWGAVVVAASSLAALVVVYGSAPALILAGAAAVLVLLTSAMLRTGVRLDVALFAFVALAAPWNAVRISPSVTLADGLLFACFVLAVLRPARRSPPPPALIGAATGIGLVIIGGVIASIAAGTEALGPAVKYATASLGVMAVVTAMEPEVRHVRLWLAAFATGAALSGVFGLVNDASGLLGRELGLTTHPNHLGLASCLGVFAALGAAEPTHRMAWKLAAWTLVAANTVAVISSGSRAALLGLLAGGVLVAVALGRRFPRQMIAAGAVSAALMVLVLPQLSENNALARLLRQGAGVESAAAADELRRSAIERGFESIAANPWIGNGFPELLAAHNIYVQAVVAGGVLGLAGIVVLTSTALVRVLSLYRSATVTAVALAAATVGYLTCGLFQNILFDRYVWVILALALVFRPSGVEPSARPG
jgi:O-antigen ligase